MPELIKNWRLATARIAEDTTQFFPGWEDVTRNGAQQRKRLVFKDNRLEPAFRGTAEIKRSRITVAERHGVSPVGELAILAAPSSAIRNGISLRIREMLREGGWLGLRADYDPEGILQRMKYSKGTTWRDDRDYKLAVFEEKDITDVLTRLGLLKKHDIPGRPFVVRKGFDSHSLPVREGFEGTACTLTSGVEEVGEPDMRYLVPSRESVLATVTAFSLSPIKIKHLIVGRFPSAVNVDALQALLKSEVACIMGF